MMLTEQRGRIVRFINRRIKVGDRFTSAQVADMMNKHYITPRTVADAIRTMRNVRVVHHSSNASTYEKTEAGE